MAGWGYEPRTQLLSIVCGPHGRRIRVGQVWQSNDPRRLRAVRILPFVGRWPTHVDVENVQTGVLSQIASDGFTIGQRGWSLLKEAPRGSVRNANRAA